MGATQQCRRLRCFNRPPQSSGLSLGLTLLLVVYSCQPRCQYLNVAVKQITLILACRLELAGVFLNAISGSIPLRCCHLVP